MIDTTSNKVVELRGDYHDDEVEHLNSTTSKGVMGGEAAIDLAFRYATQGSTDPSQFKASRRQIDLVAGRYWVIYFPLRLPAGTLGPGYRVRVTVDGLERKALGLRLG